MQSIYKTADNRIFQARFVIDCHLAKITKQDTNFYCSVRYLLRRNKSSGYGVSLLTQVICHLIGSLLQLAQSQLLSDIICYQLLTGCLVDIVRTGKIDKIDSKALLAGKFIPFCLNTGQLCLLRCLRLVLFQRTQITVSTGQCRCCCRCGAA